MEYVLEDIRQDRNAKDVRLVIRKEDETDVVFGLPEQKSSSLRDRRGEEDSTRSESLILAFLEVTVLREGICQTFPAV